MTVTVALSKPIQRGDKTIDSIAVRRPDSGSLRGLALTDVMRMETDTLADLVPRLTKITKDEFQNLDPYDMVKIAKEVVSFLTTPPARSQATNQTSDSADQNLSE